MRYELYDQNNKCRDVEADINPDEMRNLLSSFKTHTKEQNSAYEYNHFVNWARKHHHVDIHPFVPSFGVCRVDM